MLFADCEDMKTLWFLYMYSWGGTVVAGLDAASLCTRPTPPPSSAAWPLGAAAQAAALHSKPRGVAQATPHRGMAGGGLVFLEIDEAEHKFYNDTVLRDAPRDPPPPPRC